MAKKSKKNGVKPKQVPSGTATDPVLSKEQHEKHNDDIKESIDIEEEEDVEGTTVVHADSGKEDQDPKLDDNAEHKLDDNPEHNKLDDNAEYNNFDDNEYKKLDDNPASEITDDNNNSSPEINGFDEESRNTTSRTESSSSKSQDDNHRLNPTDLPQLSNGEKNGNGHHLSSSDNSEELSFKLEQMNSQLSLLKSQLSSKNSEISQLTLTIDSQNIEIRSLKNETSSSLKDDEQTTQDQSKINNLQQEISNLRAELTKVRTEITEALAAKEHSEQQYENLFEKISQIKATLGARLKSNAQELATYKERVEQLESEKSAFNHSIQTLQQETISANKESDQLSHQLSELRNDYQTNLKKWSQEREHLIHEGRRAVESYERSEAMVRDLEIAIADDQSLKESINIRIAGLEEQVSSQTNYAERFRSERDQLQKALQETQKQLEIKSLEFSEKFGILDSETQDANEKLAKVTNELKEAHKQILDLQNRNKRLPTLEDEVKEKSLLIGKLRHEAVILNEHLTKALRMIKKDSEGETVDKMLITNLILSFLSFQRGDAKKFEVLQLISNYLGWDDDQKSQAGLTRGGSVGNSGHANSSISSPKRSQSTNSLALGGSDDASSAGRFMGLFAEFLERESSKRSPSDTS